MTNKILLIFLFILLSGDLIAQPYYFRHYQVEDGLSGTRVICSIQDRKGFLWFGTNDGLNRFDGYSFKVFRNEPGDPQSIGGDVISYLYEGRDGTLWIGCDKGLYSYDPKTETFYKLKNTPANQVKDISEDNLGNLWFISKFELYKYQRRTGNLVKFSGLSQFSVTSLCITADNTVWIATASGSIEQYNRQDDSFTRYEVFNYPTLSSKWIIKLSDAGNGSILIGTLNYGVKLFDTKTKKVRDLITYNPNKTGLLVLDFVKRSKSEYWIATGTGIYIYNIKSNTFSHLQKDYNDPYTITDNEVLTLCKDRQGGIWAGTSSGNINYYTDYNARFKKYFPKSVTNALSGSDIRAIAADDSGNLWIGTEDAGLNKLEPKKDIFKHFTPDGTRSTISHANIGALLNQGGQLWVGTHLNGLDVLNIKTTKVIKHYSALTHNIESDFVYCMYRTRSGRILISTQGIRYYDPVKDDFVLLEQFPPKNAYPTIFEDSKGTIWAGTFEQGVYYFNPKTGKRGGFKHDPARSNSLSANWINRMHEDSNGELWFATAKGLCKLQSEAGDFKRYDIKAGFLSNLMLAILEDSKKNLWISTSKGLACFNLINKKVRIYTKNDGILSDNFNSSAYKDSTGRMYFGCKKGLISFHPEELSREIPISSVYITGFQINNKELPVNKGKSPLKKSATYTDEIELTYNQSSFSIDFAVLNYISPAAVEYAYQLQGLSQSWTYLKKNRRVYFTGLAPGKYTLKVKASANGKWNGKVTELVIKISPPLWASVWAFLLYVVIFFIIVFYTVRYYHRLTEEKHRNQKEKEVYQAKIEFFTNVAHEIRTPLTLIKGPLDMVMESANEVPSIRNNLQIMEKNTDLLLNLTNQLLDFRKMETSGFSLSFVKTNITALVNDTCLRFRAAATQKKLNFSYNLTNDGYAYVDMEAVNKIISNLLDNAIKYAKKKVSVHLLPFDDDDKTFTILIKNDGCLIPSELKNKVFETFFRIKETSMQTGTGIGLSMAHSLTELHKGTLELKEPENSLNVFALTLPVHQEIKLNR